MDPTVGGPGSESPWGLLFVRPDGSVVGGEVTVPVRRRGRLNRDEVQRTVVEG